MCMKEKVNSYTGKGLKYVDIIGYLKETYGMKEIIVKAKQHRMWISPFLQSDFGKEGDCTLVSILTIVKRYNQNVNANEVYNFIEEIAKKYFYNGDAHGTIPVFNKAIIKETFKKFNINKKITTKYFKGVGFNLKTIIGILDKNEPIMISIYKDGRQYYENHTITIIGYDSFIDANNNEKIMLLVFDNWHKTLYYLDYEALNPICEICY